MAVEKLEKIETERAKGSGHADRAGSSYAEAVKLVKAAEEEMDKLKAQVAKIQGQARRRREAGGEADL